VWPLGSGFFVAPKVFLTCHHVVNSVTNPHQPGDHYQLIQSLAANTAVATTPFVASVGTDLHLYPDQDAAILQVPGDAHPFAAIGYSDFPEGAEIGVAGYPLSSVLPGQNGGPVLINVVYRVAKGVVTATYSQSIKPGPEPQTAMLNTLEVNFLFVPGNSGGPIFDAETGRVFAFVHGFRDTQIVQRFADTSPGNVANGAPPKHVEALHAVYSIGIRLDGIRTVLEGFGVTL
jgi:S1-C subfamily serine protease